MKSQCEKVRKYSSLSETLVNILGGDSPEGLQSAYERLDDAGILAEPALHLVPEILADAAEIGLCSVKGDGDHPAITRMEGNHSLLALLRGDASHSVGVYTVHDIRGISYYHDLHCRNAPSEQAWIRTLAREFEELRKISELTIGTLYCNHFNPTGTITLYHLVDQCLGELRFEGDVRFNNPSFTPLRQGLFEPVLAPHLLSVRGVNYNNPVSIYVFRNTETEGRIDISIHTKKR